MNDFEHLDVIGTTTPAGPDDLPFRLAPVYRDRHDPDTYFLPVGDTDQEETLGPVSACRIKDEIETGDIRLFNVPRPARSGHWLLQIEADKDPEYLPAAQGPERLLRACTEALRHVAKALSGRDRARAESWAWYSVRAGEESDPLPLMVLIALVRLRGEHQHAAMLEEDLRMHATALQRAERLGTLARESGLRPLLDLLSQEQRLQGLRSSYAGLRRHEDRAA